MTERLQKYLARAGVASRRAAETLILEGRVSVNGETVVRLGTQVGIADEVRVDGRRIAPEDEKRYLMLHKPAGFVTTLSDPQGRPTVADLIGTIPERIYPVGRLDYDSEGLLLLTNDGDWALRLQHPRYGVPKRYRVKARGHLTRRDLAHLAKGILLEDGPFQPLSVQMEDKGPASTWVEMVITEGRNRIVRRAFEALGFPVQRLIRVAVGVVELGNLKTGRYRDLTATERENLAGYLKKSA